MKRKKFSKDSSKKKINSKAQSKFNDSCYADFLSLSKKIDDELNFFPRDYSFIIFQTLRLFNKFTTYDLSDYNDIYKNFQHHRSNLEIIEINEREHFSYEIIQLLQEIFNLTTTKQIIKQNKQDLPEKLVKLQFLIFSCAGAKIVAIFEITDPNLFFVYEVVDVSNYDDGYLLRLYSVLENAITKNVEKHYNHSKIEIVPVGKTSTWLLLNCDSKKTKKKIDVKDIKQQESFFLQQINEFWNRYDTYSDNITCHYRKVAHEHDFELVGWHRLKSGILQDQMTVSFSDIEQVESNILPKLIIQVWDIECGSKRGPGFFPVAEQPDDYIYMMQLDIFLYNQSQPLKRYNITSLPINTSLFFEKYGNEISCSLNDFNFVLVNSEEEILLEFAKLNYLYQKDIEIGYNTGGFDWPFVLKKAKLLGISDKFFQQLLGKKSKLIYNIQETKVRIIDNDVDERMQKYQFAGLNINNRDIKVNPMEKQTCEYFYVQGSIFLDLLVWAKKIFQNELKHTLAHILKKSIKFQNDELLLSEFATKLSKLCKIDYQKCFDAMSDSSVLEEYAIDLAYYCSVDTLRLQELLIK
ncbi:ribonuclease H-like domain-containing protein [Gigaspora rosea]|uniref:DNA polymerase delta catalytic subunit n=1 Tax=Gigaspora rosea TaxID=44941 RepID=A0A397VRT2_9GLOM|nr:ribonuclease H-like domain-containing protein [Gigaspora rosea]